jgi:hypothetical protein
VSLDDCHLRRSSEFKDLGLLRIASGYVLVLSGSLRGKDEIILTNNKCPGSAHLTLTVSEISLDVEGAISSGP